MSARTLVFLCATGAAAALTASAPQAIATGAALRTQSPYIHAIEGARIVPVSGAVIEQGTIVFRDGVITAVGAGAKVPPGAVVTLGKGLTVYPGLIDMGSTAGLRTLPAPRAENPQTTEDVERVKADYLLRAHLRAAEHLDATASALARAAAAGITSVLATPPGDALRGQSAMIHTALPEDLPQIGGLADERTRALVVATPVALHVTFSPRPAGGGAYPNSLMGVIAFVRQAFLDAQHWAVVQKARSAGAARTIAPEAPVFAPALEAMQPALTGRMPVAFQGETAREILRGLEMAKAFSLTPIITNAREADRVANELKAANARVIYSLNFPVRPDSLAPDADESLRTLRARAEAPRTPAALAKAGITFAFASDGMSDPKEFVKAAAKTVQQGLSKDEALRALTLAAATMAGAGDRVGSLDVGKLANIVVTEGDLFDEKMTIKQVFVSGRPVEMTPPPARTP